MFFFWLGIAVLVDHFQASSDVLVVLYVDVYFFLILACNIFPYLQIVLSAFRFHIARIIQILIKNYIYIYIYMCVCVCKENRKTKYSKCDEFFMMVKHFGFY